MNMTVFFIVAVVIHELGHAIVATLFGVTIKRLHLSFTGAGIVRERTVGIREVLICVAGPVFNLLVLPLHPSGNWLMVNAVLFIVNIIPIKNSDGTHALEAIKKSFKVVNLN